MKKEQPACGKVCCGADGVIWGPRVEWQDQEDGSQLYIVSRADRIDGEIKEQILGEVVIPASLASLVDVRMS